MIRPPKKTDIRPLTLLLNSDTNVFGDSHTGFEEQDITEYIKDTRKKFLVYEHGGKIIAALIAEMHDTYCHLETLIVAEPFRHQGFGKLLLSALEDDLKASGIQLTEVMTRSDNKVMKQFLEKRGFKKGGNFDFYSKNNS